MINELISKRKIVHIGFSLLIFLGISYYSTGLTYIIIFGSLLGIVLGKVFCRWMCPIGLFMELILGQNKENRFQQLYMYHKMGCPIAWISGLLNRWSLFQVRKNAEECISCGKCDKACYITTLNKNYSFLKKNGVSPTTNYSCSKCLECVASCPTGSLRFKV